jgi:hypothetical protein
LAKLGRNDMAPYLIEILSNDSHEPHLSCASVLLADLIDGSQDTDRNSLIQKIISHLRDYENHKYHHFSNRLATVLIGADSKYTNMYLPELILLLDTGVGEQALWIIESIQANCRFYNYEVLNSLPPPIKSHPPGKTINIQNVGNLNTGNVNIAGNQIGETK